MPANASPARPVKASPAKPVSVNTLPAVASPSRGPNELETLQIAYDEYVEFSKEVESELEQSLKATEAKLADITTKKSLSDAKLTTALAKSTQLSKELQQVQNDLVAAREKVRCTDEMTKKLENTNDALLDKVRILETTEADLTHKLENAEEDIIFLQSDLNEVKEKRIETERKLREQLSALQAELVALNGVGQSYDHTKTASSAVSPPSHSEHTVITTESAACVIPTEQNLLVQVMESTGEDLTSRLTDSESKVHDLSENVGRLTEDELEISGHVDSGQGNKKRELKLEALVRGLNTQLLEAKGFLAELEESNTILEETNTELYLANADLDALNADLEEENTALKNENVELREENSLLDDKFLISKQFALESNGDLEEMKRELQEKNRQLGALQNAMEEVTSEQAERDLQIMKLKAEIASNFVELESVKVQLSVLHTIGSTGGEDVRTANIEATSANSAETEGVIERLKQTVRDLTVRSEFFYEEKSEEECDTTAIKGHGQLIAELRNSVDSLQETLEGFEWNLQHAAAQLKIGKDALSHAECERDQMTSNVQRLGERLLAREVEVKSAHKEGREIESIASALVTPTKSLSFSPVKVAPESEGEDVGYVLEPVEDWEEERAELIARCQAYRLEIDESRAQAALQQRQALLADFPALTPGTKSKIRSSSSPVPMPRSESEDKDMAAVKAPESQSASPILTGTTSLRIAAELALASDDVEKLKSELNIQLDRYDSVRTTNARLLQKLQAVKGNIQVCCRTRPPTDQERAAAQLSHVGTSPIPIGKVCVDISDENEISCFDKRSEMWRSFTFDRVWPFDTTQADVFGDVEPLVLSVTEGFNTCLFAYGQTGSGKTFTMNGYGREYGISYRTLQKIFETLELKKNQAIAAAERVERAARKLVRRTSSISLDALSASDKEKGDLEITWRDTDSNRDKDSDEECPAYAYSVTVSMMEIYNEQVFDLLLTQSPAGQGSGLDIRQAPDGSVGVPGLHTVDVCSLADVMEVFAKGSNNRATTSTNLNEHSSRSHLIMLIEVSTAQGESPPVKSKLFLVDLAGSERVGKSGVTGQAMKEAQYINKSLSALGDVMEALDQKAKFVPYRNSKLTYLLQDALGGNSRTMMVVTVCPTDVTSDETLFTLQFATRVRNITMGAAKRNAATGKNLEEAVKALKTELKESRKKRLQLEENIGEIKKEQRKTTDKSATVMDVKVRAAEEKKAKIEILYELLQRSHQDLTARLAEEKESKLKVQEALKDAQKETEKERADKLRERMEREKLRIMEREEAARQVKVNIGKERYERFKDQSRVISASKDRLSLTTSRKINDTDSESVNESVCTSASPPEDSPRSTALAQTDTERERARFAGYAGFTKASLTRTPSTSSIGGLAVTAGSKGAVSRGSVPSKQAVLNRSQNMKTLNTAGLHSDSEAGRNGTMNRRSSLKTTSAIALSSSLPIGRNSVRKEKEKEEECSVEGQSRLKPSSSDEMEDTSEVPQLGPPIAPAVRSNIAARSKEALLRHQLRMEKRRTDKLSHQTSLS